MKTKEFNKIKPYTYLVTRLSDNKKYHGVRWGNKVPPIKDLGVVYFTSSKKIKNEFKHNPSNFKIKLCWTFDTVNEARLHEQKVNKKIYKRTIWINKNAFPAIFNKTPTMLGKKHSDETRKKISEWNQKNHPMRGKKHSLETKKKISQAGKGMIHSEQSKILMSINRKGKHKGKQHKMFGKKLNRNHPFILAAKARKGIPLKEEVKKKLSKAHMGKIISFETRKKTSLSQMGKKNHMFGKKHSLATKNKIRLRSLKRWTEAAKHAWSGKNHHNFGKKWTEEHKNKIGLSVKGNKNGMFGRKHSEETKQKIRLKAIERRKHYG